MKLLEEEKEAITREVKAAERALEAERKLLQATKNESQLITSALDAEKEAKAAAESEIERLKKELTSTEEQLQEESRLAKDIGYKARKVLTLCSPLVTICGLVG